VLGGGGGLSVYIEGDEYLTSSCPKLPTLVKSTWEHKYNRYNDGGLIDYIVAEITRSITSTDAYDMGNTTVRSTFEAQSQKVLPTFLIT